MNISIIMPAKNESKSLATLLPKLMKLYPMAEIIVVDDGSSDDTKELCAQIGVRCVVHPYSKGNGASIKTGIRVATKDIIVCMDADGQHRPEDVQILLDKLGEGYDMVVGSRSASGQASASRSIANRIYNVFSSWMVGHKVVDLTSGFRAIRANKFREFISLLPNKFSYPTTITMSFFRVGYSVAYVPVHVQKRHEGTHSHIRLWQDGVRFLLIIFKIGSLFSPLKLFFPISISLFLVGLSYYFYTFLTVHRLTNMSVLLFMTSILVFLLGLISEQITSLLYKDSNKHE